MTKTNENPVKKIKKKTFIEKGMDFWFYNENTVKVLRGGIIFIAIVIWIFIPILVVWLFYKAVTQRNVGALLLGALLTYSFFGIVNALSNILKLLKSFTVESLDDKIPENNEKKEKVS